MNVQEFMWRQEFGEKLLQNLVEQICEPYTVVGSIVQI